MENLLEEKDETEEGTENYLSEERVTYADRKDIGSAQFSQKGGYEGGWKAGQCGVYRGGKDTHPGEWNNNVGGKGAEKGGTGN